MRERSFVCGFSELPGCTWRSEGVNDFEAKLGGKMRIAQLPFRVPLPDKTKW